MANRKCYMVSSRHENYCLGYVYAKTAGKAKYMGLGLAKDISDDYTFFDISAIRCKELDRKRHLFSSDTVYITYENEKILKSQRLYNGNQFYSSSTNYKDIDDDDN